MDSTQFLAQFAHIANAAGGAARLRELVLALAVQGRLVSQDESEEPAEAQLSRIKELALATPSVDRRRKSATLKIPSAISSEKRLPVGWVTARIGELVRVLNGRAYSKQELLESGTPIVPRVVV